MQSLSNSGNSAPESWKNNLWDVLTITPYLWTVTNKPTEIARKCFSLSLGYSELENLELWEYIIASKENRLIVAIAGTDIIGWALWDKWTFSRNWLYHLAVLEPYRGLGVGSALLQEVPKNSCLGVMDRYVDKLESFYTKNGWERLTCVMTEGGVGYVFCQSKNEIY